MLFGLYSSGMMIFYGLDKPVLTTITTTLTMFHKNNDKNKINIINGASYQMLNTDMCPEEGIILSRGKEKLRSFKFRWLHWRGLKPKGSKALIYHAQGL